MCVDALRHLFDFDNNDYKYRITSQRISQGTIKMRFKFSHIIPLHLLALINTPVNARPFQVDEQAVKPLVALKPPARTEFDFSSPADIRISNTCMDLRDLLATISDDKIRFVCGNSLRDAKVQVHVSRLNRIQILQSISTLYNAEWTKRSDTSVPTYQLDMTPDAVKRRTEWWQRFQRERPSALRRMRDATYVGLSGKERKFTPETPSHISEETNRYAQFVGTLPDTMRRAIADSFDDTPYYQVGAITVSSGSLSSLTQPLTAGTPEHQSAQLVVSNLVVSNNVSPSYIRSRNDGMIHVELLDASRKPIGKRFTLNLPNAKNIYNESLLKPDHMGLLRTALGVYGPPPKLSEDARVLASYQMTRYWENGPLPKTLKQTRYPLLERSGVLQAIATAAEQDLIADCYTEPAVGLRPADERQIKEETAAAIQSKDLARYLNEKSVAYDFSWKDTPGVLLVRHNRWYRADYLEVPTKLLVELYRQKPDLGARPGASPPQPGAAVNTSEMTKQMLDYEILVLGKLSLFQIANGFRWATFDIEMVDPAGNKRAVQQRPFSGVSNAIMASRPLLKFYSGLSETQRALLCAGQLPLVQLSPSQVRDGLDLVETTGESTATERSRFGVQRNRLYLLTDES
jgi:hypothetical protein